MFIRSERKEPAPGPAIMVRKWYDRSLRLWTVWAEDAAGNQIGETEYATRSDLSAVVGRRVAEIGEAPSPG